MKSFELILNLKEDEFLDWLDDNVLDVPVLVEMRGFEQSFVTLVGDADPSPPQRSFILSGILSVHRNNLKMTLFPPEADLGQVRLDIVPQDDNTTMVVVDADTNPYLLKRTRQLKTQLETDFATPQVEIVEAQQETAPVQDDIPFQPPRRRGGPPPMPEEDKRRIVQGWLRVQGRQTQEAYAQTNGISSSTLRRYVREIEAKT